MINWNKFNLNQCDDVVVVTIDEMTNEEVILRPEGFKEIGLILDDGDIRIRFTSTNDNKEWEFPLARE